LRCSKADSFERSRWRTQNSRQEVQWKKSAICIKFCKNGSSFQLTLPDSKYCKKAPNAFLFIHFGSSILTFYPSVTHLTYFLRV